MRGGASMRLSLDEFRSQPIFVWYDYFSCPQLERDYGEGSALARAIDSIPAYITNCAYFFVLCPVIESPDQSTVFNASTWAERGWCRVERTIRDLSSQGPWIIIKSATNLELFAAPLTALGGPPGEGTFSLQEDRPKLVPVLQRAIKAKLISALESEEFARYRAELNLQPFHLRGLDVEPLQDIVPGFDPQAVQDPKLVAAERFLYQNGFNHCREVDEVGWSPLCYAALNGDSAIIQGLLTLRANPSDRSKKDHPHVGVGPAGMPVVGICAWAGNNEAMKTLIAAGGKFEGGITPPIVIAAFTNNPAGIRILSDAGARPDSTNVVGASALVNAASSGSLEALEELFTQLGDAANVSEALYSSMAFRGGSAEMVERLVAARADVNEQQRPKNNMVQRAVVAFLSLRYKWGHRSIMTRLGYHQYGATPLMAAVITGQWEGAAALIASGARLDIRNSRGFTAADFAQQRTVPDFVAEGLEGQPEACQRVTLAASARSCFSI